MTPKEKADELVNKFTPHTKVFHEHLGWVNYLDSTKQCAFIAVDELIEEVAESADDEVKFMRVIYWEKVKQEINNL
jgi:hypothetical protein